MKPLYRVLVAVVAVVGAASTVAAQTPGLLNRLEVQKLVATDTPEANASLAAHFTALADRYTADAARHKGMAQAYSAHSNRSAVTNGRTHCERLAALAAESGSAAREMATYHRDLADGRAAATPKGAGAFQSGKGAPEPNAEQLHHLAMTAKTRDDHLALEEYFVTLAKKKTADAEDHVAMARAYRAGVRKGTYDPAVHCDRLARLAREAAKEATAAASLHKQLANVG
jgi:hypothetical protein